MNRTLLFGSLLMVLSLVIFGYLLRSPYEMTRLRNSFIFEIGDRTDFVWLPTSPPDGYEMETQSPPPEFKKIAISQGFTVAGASEFPRAMAIARHLTAGDETTGVPIQSTNLDAYHKITDDNVGYCSDYTQVFNALSLASGIPVREWGMSFDGFSGRGHAFSEIYDSDLNKWVFIDPFYSFYVVDVESGVPLSVLELRERLLQDEDTLSLGVKEIDQGAFAFDTSQRAIDYYSRGAEQFYLWYGNNVFSYEDNPVIDLAAGFGRAIEQGIAIVIGAFPETRIVPHPNGRHWVSRLTITFWLFVTAVLLTVSACGVYISALVRKKTAKVD